MAKTIGVTVPYSSPICLYKGELWVYRDGKPIIKVYEHVKDAVFELDADDFEETYFKNHPLGEKVFSPETDRDKRWREDFPIVPTYNAVWYADGKKYIGGIGGGIAPVFVYVLENNLILPKVFWRII